MTRMVVYIAKLNYDIDLIPTDELTTSDDYYLITRYDDSRYVVQRSVSFSDSVHSAFITFIGVFLALCVYSFLFGGGNK